MKPCRAHIQATMPDGSQRLALIPSTDFNAHWLVRSWLSRGATHVLVHLFSNSDNHEILTIEGKQ